VEVLDRWVAEGRYPSRSRAMQEAVELLVKRDNRNRLRREVAKLNPGDEQRLADENLDDEQWPEFQKAHTDL
jgi:Arc/MetJ-type ribon-helix-helix transcriptional regulator